MSCNIVSKRTIDRILVRVRFNRRMIWILDGMTDHHRDEIPTDELNELGKRILKMNRLNIERVYPRERGKGEIENEYRFASIPCRKIQLYKSIENLLYNCCDSDLICNTKLYNALKKIKDEVAMEIIQRIPEYDDADWD